MPTGQEALVKGLEHEWPRYLGYFVSFAFIGGVWIAHSNMTRFIKAADQALMRLNLTLLLFVSFLPFTTAIAATHLFASSLPFTHHTVTHAGLTAERVAVVLFGLNLTGSVEITVPPDPGGTHGLPRDQAREPHAGPRGR